MQGDERKAKGEDLSKRLLRFSRRRSYHSACFLLSDRACSNFCCVPPIFVLIAL